MGIDAIKKNIGQEKILMQRLNSLIASYSGAGVSEEDKINIRKVFGSTTKQLKILNDSIPDLLNEISLFKEMPSQSKSLQTTKKSSDKNDLEIYGGNPNLLVGIKKKDRKEYFKNLEIAEEGIKNLKKRNKKEKEELVQEFKKANKYIKLSNKFFGKISNDLVGKGDFARLQDSLRKGNFMTLTNSYVSMMFFTTLLAGFLGIFLALFFLFVNITTSFPFLSLVNFSEINILFRILKVIWLIPAVPAATFLILYYYPLAEKTSLQQSLDYELPFATIQMAAIAGSNIEPSNIFRIIALSKEYPYMRNEAKKLMNQINLYGYDLSTALNNIARASPSKSWSELIGGISTTIRSGGNLSKYLNKKAESLLFEYRIKREKATKSSETFMDIYISVVIAAPMLMMLLLVMINISGIGFSFTIPLLTLLVVTIVTMINIIFIIFLHLSQKKI